MAQSTLELNEPRCSAWDVERRARALVDSHSHFHGRADKFEFLCRADVLVLRGSVPSFYLKQVLQSLVRNLEGVRRIENQVRVISSEGLSSEVGDQ